MVPVKVLKKGRCEEGVSEGVTDFDGSWGNVVVPGDLLEVDGVGFQESYFRTLKAWFGQMNALRDSRQHKSLLVLDSGLVSREACLKARRKSIVPVKVQVQR